jgi:multiple sugar transport system ATP-binding protein
LGVRPADLEDADVWSPGSLPTIEVVADVTEELGSEVNVLFGIDAPPVATEELAAAAEEADDTIGLLGEETRATFCARVDARTKARPGQTVRLSLDPSRFHYFDPQTGEAIPAGAAATVGASSPS